MKSEAKISLKRTQSKQKEKQTQAQSTAEQASQNDPRAEIPFTTKSDEIMGDEEDEEMFAEYEQVRGSFFCLRKYMG